MAALPKSLAAPWTTAHMHPYIGAYTLDLQVCVPEDTMPFDAAARPVPATTAAIAASVHQIDPRTRRLIEAPIAPTLLRLAWPNIAVMLVMASTGLIEAWWVSRLGV